MTPVAWEDMLGAPFKLGGRSIERGIDCFGLLQEYFRRAGREIPDPFTDYGGEDVRVSAKAAAAFGDLWTVGDGREIGDVALLRQGREQTSILHVGILVEPDRILHSLKGCGVAVTSLRHYGHLILAWYRLAEVPA